MWFILTPVTREHVDEIRVDDSLHQWYTPERVMATDVAEHIVLETKNKTSEIIS